MNREVGKLGFAPPKISYLVAMRSWFVLNGTAYSVEMCPSALLIQFLNGCRNRRSAKSRPSSFPQMIEGDDSGLMRWFVVTMMLESGYTIPLFPTEQEAMNSLNNSS